MSNDELQVTMRKRLTALVEREKHRGGMAVVDAILEHPEAISLLGSMEPQEMHTLLLDIGRRDCVDLIRYATGEQLHGLADLDCWVSGQFLPERLEDLLSLISAAGDETLLRTMKTLEDTEIVLYLLRRARVIARDFDPDQDDEMHAPGSEVFLTPDAMFYIVLPEEDPSFPNVKYFVDVLYISDRERAVSLLKTAVFEDADTLESQNIRFRDARVRSMGFPGKDEVDELFSYLNPVETREKARTRLDAIPPVEEVEPTLLPALMDVASSETPFLQEALDLVDAEAARGSIREGLAWLSNVCVVWLTGGDLGAEEKRAEGVQLATSLFNLGLQYLSDNDSGRAAQLLERVTPRTLFRTGFSLTVPLRQRASRLIGVSGREQGFFLFDPPLDEVIRGCLGALPLYYTGLEMDEEDAFRNFTSISEARKTKSALRQAEEVARFVVTSLRLDPVKLAEMIPQSLRPAVTHTTLMATALLNALSGREDLLRPLPQSDISNLAQVVLVESQEGGRCINPRLEEAVKRFLEREENRFAAALFDLALRKLEAVFSQLPPGVVPDRKFLMPTVLVD